MNLHEYQSKELMKKYGVKVLSGIMAQNPEDAVAAAKKLHSKSFVIKAQIHAGGRGKAGGVKIATNLNEVKKISTQLIGNTLVTKQTGPLGKVVRKVYIEEPCEIEKEFYLALLLDRTNEEITFVVSAEGGMDIEKLAKEHPEKIIKIPVRKSVGYSNYISRNLASILGITGELCQKADEFFRALYKLYVEKDCSLVEINPLVITKDNELVALDAKIQLDDNALLRHPELFKLRDTTEESQKEVEASEFGLSYIELDGNIGCLVNGAGLAMATMDIIKAQGGNPANFLDIGGSASKEAVEKAILLLHSDEKVKAIFVNIFGGIMRCDLIAEGLIQALGKVQREIPIVVRLEGTNVALGKKLLKDFGPMITAIDDLTSATKDVVAKAKELDK